MPPQRFKTNKRRTVRNLKMNIISAIGTTNSRRFIYSMEFAFFLYTFLLTSIMPERLGSV